MSSLARMADLVAQDAPDLHPFGWAPGFYSFRCCDCPPAPGILFTGAMGSKRSWRCEKHAREAYEANKAKTTTIDSEMCPGAGVGRKGHFMRLASGTKYWPLDPRPEEIFIDDIAASLSRLCRFNGHVIDNATKGYSVDKMYTVAEHSYWCSYQVPEEDQFEALMHDASEAFTGDLIRPMKVVPEIAAVYKPIEEMNERAIARRFNLRFPYPDSVKDADEAVCTRELRTIMAGAAERAENQAVLNTRREANIQLQCWSPSEARAWFLKRFFQLSAIRMDPMDIRRQIFLSPTYLERNQG